MKYCENCGNPLEDGVLFCEACGEKVKLDDLSSVEEFQGAEDKSDNTKEKEKSKKKWIFGGATVAVIVGIAIGFTVLFYKGDSEKEVMQGQKKNENIANSSTPIPTPTEAVTSTPEVTVVPTEPSDTSYVLSESNTKYLKNKDVQGISKENLRLARNEIYARHGYIFSDGELTAFFKKKAWYNPTIKRSEWKDDVLNKYEKANVTFLYSKEKGISKSDQPLAKPKVNEFEDLTNSDEDRGFTYRVKWNKVPGASGYQYSSLETVAWISEEPNRIKEKTTLRYYKIYTSSEIEVKFKVRAYKKVNGKIKYGPWSRTVC